MKTMIPLKETNDFEMAVHHRFDECESTLLSKHKDYGPKNIANSPGGPLNGLRVRMHDKLARLNNLIDSGGTPKHESLRDSFLDMANYGIIGLLVVDGKWPGAPATTPVAAPRTTVNVSPSNCKSTITKLGCGYNDGFIA